MGSVQQRTSKVEVQTSCSESFCSLPKEENMIRKVLPSAFRLLTVSAEAGSFRQATRSVLCRAACVGATTGTTRTFMAPSMKSMEMPASSNWLYGVPHPPVMQPDSVAELLVTCIGNHQTGVVRDVTKTIAEFGGSITHSKSMELDGLQFVYMASVHVGDREKANILRMTLNDMRVNATWIPLDNMNVVGAPVYKKHTLKVDGLQRSGLIFTFSEGLATKGVKINDMTQNTFLERV